MMATQVQASLPYVSWDRFKELFNDKYFLLSLMMVKKREFMELKQAEDISVAQYKDVLLG